MARRKVHVIQPGTRTPSVATPTGAVAPLPTLTCLGYVADKGEDLRHFGIRPNPRGPIVPDDVAPLPALNG